MITPTGPMVLEYNCRFGDPETQVLLPLLTSDLVDVFCACVDASLVPDMVQWAPNTAACTVVCAAGGYPGVFGKGDRITGLDDVRAVENVTVYQAGTKCVERGQRGGSDGLHDHCDSDDGAAMKKQRRSAPVDVVTTGGRVLAVTGVGASIRQAVRAAYLGVDKLAFRDMCCRRDIGHRWGYCCPWNRSLHFMPLILTPLSLSDLSLRALNAPLRVAILGSTRGTDMEAIVTAIAQGSLNATIAVCISNKQTSGILDRAARHSIPALHIGAAGLTREEYDRKVGTCSVRISGHLRGEDIMAT